MKETVMPLLGPGATFPALPLTPPGQPTLTLPKAFAGDFAVVLFFRGSWCPYCNAQLRGFQRASASLAETGIKVAALSVDDEPTTAGLIAKYGLTFPVGHSADARAIAELTGAFINPQPVFLQSTGFVLSPPGPSPDPPDRSSTPSRSICSPPASAWTPPGRSSSASPPAAPSAGSSPTTSPAWSATYASTPRPDP